MTNAPRPGWYPDPAGASDAFRWWDGQSWTDHLSDTPNAPRPSDAEDPPRRRSRFRAVIALVVVVALFLSAGVGVGLWLWDVGGGRNGDTGAPGRPRAAASTDSSRDPSRGRSTGSASAPAEPPGQLDERTRTATIGDASLQLPGDPYELHSDPGRVPGLMEAVFMAEAEVHDRFDGDHDWSAMVGLAALSPQVTNPDDLAGSGKAVLRRLAAVLYGNGVTKVSDPDVADCSVDGYPGIEFTASIHYAIDRLPSRYDTVRGIVVKLDDGTLVTALSAVPDDAGPRITRLAAESLQTLTIT